METGAFKDTTITITNSGTDTLHVSDIIANPSIFTVSSTLFTIPPGQSVTDTLRFTPTAVGSASGTLLVMSNAFTSPDRLTLSAIGLAPPRTLPSDTSTVTYLTTDSTHVAIQFQSGTVSGRTLTFESFGPDRPTSAQAVPGFSKPLLYFSINTSIPDSVAFTARITLTYTNAQLAAAGITDERSLTAAVFDSAHATWTLMATTIDTTANTATFTSTHFSTWALASVGPTGIDAPTGPARPPRTFALHQNYPNPFNPTTTIRFDLPTPAAVTLRVYNLRGQEVATLLNEEHKPAGSYAVRWDGRTRSGQRAASGIYLYRLSAGSFVQSKKMLLLR